MKDFQIQVEGMSCQHCVMRVKKALENLAGVKDVAVDLKKKSASGKFDENTATLEQIKEAVTKTGYQAK